MVVERGKLPSSSQDLLRLGGENGAGKNKFGRRKWCGWLNKVRVGGEESRCKGKKGTHDALKPTTLPSSMACRVALSRSFLRL